MATLFRNIWVFVRPYRKRLFMGLLCGLLYALSSGATMLLVRAIVNLVFPGTGHFSVAEQLERVPAMLRPLTDRLAGWLPELRSPISKSGQVLIICTLPALMLLRSVAGYLNAYLTHWAAARTIGDLRARLFDHLQNLSASFFTEARTGELITRVINDTYVIHSVVANSMAAVIKDPLTVLALITVLLLQSSTRTLTLVSMVVLPICLVPVSIYARKVRKSAQAMQSHLAELSGVMHESFTGNRVIKAYNLEARALAQFTDTTRKFIGQMMRLVRANEIPAQLTEFLGVVGVALVMIYVALQAQPSTPGDFVAFVLSIVLMYQPIKALVRLHNQINQAAAASQHVFDLLRLERSVTEPDHPVPLHAAGADLWFENIHFAYGQRPVLRGIDLKVQAGQFVALVGSSGAGKTSLANLLLRFYDPQRGVIWVGDTDIRRVGIKDLRRQIALVTQEIILFNDTIRNNILLGRPEATEMEIEAAARHAHALEFIREKPHGFGTIVGEKGALLSAGQRQRLAIARAILKDAPILVLDEATSSLDTESERAVQAALERLMQGRTTICIAHRLSTIQNADLIVVLDAGRIAETGTHADLLRARGLYAKLYELQFDPAQVPAPEPALVPAQPRP
jgi:subfamily B ATP-binding cassette protein MsbA